MAFQTLYRAKSFGPGSKLWVVPPSEDSDVVRKIDWYLNFQMAKSKKHVTFEMHKDLKKMIEEHTLKLPQLSLNENAPLMISASHSFPCDMIVQLKNDDSQVWIKQIEKIWLKLDRPCLRVFLPKNQTPESFQKLWSQALNTAEDISLVPA